MPFDLMLAFAGYAFVTSITPGPNNTMLLTSGVNFGFRRSLPHLLGVNLGFGMMVLAVGLGVGALFSALPQFYTLLRIVGAAYMLYLAWSIATDAPMSVKATEGRTPMSFLGAAAFQWVNPKAWIMAIGAISTYAASDGHWYGVAAVALLYCVVNAPCIAAWAACGVALQRLLTNPRHVRAFNLVMAAVLCASIYPSIVDLLHGR